MKKNVLLAEDNEGDIVMISEALEECGIELDIEIARDGQQAIQKLQYAILAGPEKYPDLILLDINMPKMNGHEVLDWIKSKDEIKHIPVVMLTTSSSNLDIMSAYRNHANSYITKPMMATEYNQIIASLEQYWMRINQSPKE